MRLGTRWARFSIVGLLGIAVQLGVLSALVYGAGIHYLVATALAVEAAVLHNFSWHERWTWRDRPSGTPGRLAHRLLAFHVLNGTVSILGNLVLVAWLVRTAGLDPISSNLAAIAACSALTFAACEWRVFARAATAAVLMGIAGSAATAAVSAAPTRSMATAAGPTAATLQAWASYTADVEARFDAASADTRPFFALDAFGVQAWRETVMAGAVPAWQFERPRPQRPEISVPDGAIHHWTGAIFVPNMTVATAYERVRQLAGNEAPHYDDVLASKLLGKDQESARVFLRLQRTKVVTVTYNTEHTIDYRRLGPTRAAVRSVATRIAELDHANTPREREAPPGTDSGYLWRLNAYWRYEAVGTGVLIECESVSLSRSVPLLLRPFLSGVVQGLARESLEQTLVGLRRALTA